MLAVSSQYLLAVRGHVDAYGHGEPRATDLPRAEVLVSRIHSAAILASLGDLPAEARMLFVGEARIALARRPAIAGSAYDRPVVADLLDGATGPPEIDRRVRELGVTHVIVNHRELARWQRGYAFAERLPPGGIDLLGRWLSELEPLAQVGETVAYRVPAGPP